MQKLRKCREEREDFTHEDGSAFPMYVEKGGELYGFCPGKATWDHDAVALYRLLLVSAHTGTMMDNGPLIEQSDFWIDLLSWFLPFYDHHRFVSRVRMVIGDDKKG